MECSICLNEITKATGLVTLSCCHNFHLACIGKWVLKNESCPLCRHALIEEERIAEEEDDEATEIDDDAWEDDDDEEDDMPNIRWRRVGLGRWIVEDEDDEDAAPDIPEFNPEEHALWNVRALFGPLNDENIPIEQAAVKIQAIAHVNVRNNVRDGPLVLHLRNNRQLAQFHDDRGYESA
jgi:hypothetical protein